MASISDRLTSPTLLRNLAVVLMLAGLAIVVFEEATIEVSTIGLLVIAAGLLCYSVSQLLVHRAAGQSSSG